MFERGIQKATVVSVLQSGEAIEKYPDDLPYPSCLLIGYSAVGTPIHVVAALAPHDRACHVITVYVPDPDRWSQDFKTRRSP